MKHSIKITLLLVGMFIVSQFLGLWIINHYIDRSSGTPIYRELPYEHINLTELLLCLEKEGIVKESKLEIDSSNFDEKTN